MRKDLALATPPAPLVPAAFYGGGGLSRERGMRTTPEQRILNMQAKLVVPFQLRAVILMIRDMDRRDGRVKKIHSRLARDVVRSGLQLTMPTANARIRKAWDQFEDRLQLCNPQKLKSDARGLVMEGSLCLQWVLDADNHVAAGVRMPAETMRAVATPAGVFEDPSRAFEQLDFYSGEVMARFPLWQMTMGRMDPLSFDDVSEPGRPYMDASREVWMKLRMTEDDLVIRRHERAPMRTAHVLKGASPEKLAEYKAKTEDEQKDIANNYYMNVDGSVTALQGDANMDQIADAVHLLETFFSGAPAPAGLFGYTEDISRDILEDLTQDYYQEVDSVQTILAHCYRQGFELELMLQGIDPSNYDFEVGFIERLTETPNQAADRALKVQAMGASQETVWTIAGLNPEQEKERKTREAEETDPYPPEGDPEDPAAAAGGGGNKPTVKITPGNRTKGESGTNINNATG